MSDPVENWLERFFSETCFYPDDGYQKIKQHYRVTIKNGLFKIMLTLVLRDIPAVSFHLIISKKHKTLRTSPFYLPKTQPLSSKELLHAEEILKKLNTLYMSEYLNNALIAYDLSQGSSGLAKQTLSFATELIPSEEKTPWTISHRKVKHYYVFYFQNSWQDLFTLWIDAKQEEVVGANWINVPMDKGFWLSPTLFSFIDKALKEHGDFGVYGRVTEGLSDLIQHFDVSLQDCHENNTWCMHVDPKDGHGHFLRFDIDKTNGTIHGVLAGHYAPEPTLTPDGFDE